MQLALADLYAGGGTALSQLAWELLGEPRRAAGDLACCCVHLLRASGRRLGHLLVALIALERQRAVRRPQGRRCRRAPSPPWSWLLALLLALYPPPSWCAGAPLAAAARRAPARPRLARGAPLPRHLCAAAALAPA